MTLSFDSRNAKFLLVLTALLWSSGGWLIKSVGVGPLMVAGLRSLVTGIVLVLAFRPGLAWRDRSLWWGAASYAATVISFVVATKWTSAANAILLQSTAPVYVALFGGFFLGERIRALDLATIGLVFVGMLFFFGDELSLEGFRGNVIGLASGFFFAWFILITRRFGQASPLGMIVVGNFLAAALALPFALGGPAPGPSDWLALLALGVFQLAIPYALYARAIPHVRAIDAVLIVLIEPILNPVWVFLFVGERPGFLALVGGGIVLGAVTARSIWLARTERSAATG